MYKDLFGKFVLMFGYETRSAALFDLTVSRGPYHWYGLSFGKTFFGFGVSSKDFSYKDVLADFERGGIVEQGKDGVVNMDLIVFPSWLSLRDSVAEYGEETLIRINGGGDLAYREADGVRLWNEQESDDR